MRKTLQDSQQRNANTIRPLLIYNKLRLVCRNLIPGRQEDAHEFLRYLVEAMEKSYLSRFKNHSEFDSKVKETTPLNQILGGYLRSAVRCLKCGHVSTTFQHFQDLLLDIRKAQTLDEALEGYFSREKLDDDSYHCQSCQKKVRLSFSICVPATKQFSLERAPMVLCIQLKRFSVSNNKITKHIHFRQRLDLTRYARHRPSVPLIYRLVALVTHMGPTVNCGHYTAVAQAPTGNFYQFDDSMVRVISHQAVFNTNAYIMLYELESSPFTQKSSSTANNKIKSPISPELGSSNNTSKTTVNGIGFTSDKVYGPELPPDRVEKKVNGTTATPVTNGNGNGNDNHFESSGTSDSESENAHGRKSSQKENKPVPTSQLPPKKTSLSTNNDVKTPKPPLSQKLQNRTLSSTQNVTNNAATQINSSESSVKHKETVLQPLPTKLVPYETDDSSCSDESNQSPHELEYRVSTKAAVGEWKVTSTEPTSQSKNWTEKKQDGTVNELFKMSHSGYSAPVSSWNGTRAQLDKQISAERREDRKRSFMDSSDQGKVKHQKMNNSYKSNPGYNPVQ
ncbi:ubiquitin carboxyl-terminal hydrolase 36, partial [Asbolus verrucosus]